MKFVLQILVTIALAFFLQSYFPWWTVALSSLAAGYYFKNGGFKSFGAGFIAIGLLWFTLAFYIDVTSQSILTEKVNKILPLPALALTAVIGGLVGGFAAMSGAVLNKERRH
jgi:hypothetical protein